MIRKGMLTFDISLWIVNIGSFLLLVFGMIFEICQNICKLFYLMFLPATKAENRGVSIPIFYCEI